MALEVTTKDCTALSDSELAEMADICADGGHCYEVGTLSKQVEEWVLVTLVHEGNHLRGFSFSTLERIGGTPCILLGVASIKRTSKRDAVLRAIIGDNFRRALMAFPDEDVLLGTRMSSPSGFEGFKLLSDIVPRPGHKASGEERAWGRRLAKRFGVDPDRYDDQTFVVTGDGVAPLVLDHESLKPETIDADVAAQFDGLDAERGDCIVTCGWVMAEELLKHG
ncbi:MAG: hypothetical protein ACK4V6_05230 [Microthrixaceae bacterium]